MRNTSTPNPDCPFCKSGTNKHGCKGNIRRYLCKSCNRTFYGDIIYDEIPDPKQIPSCITSVEIGQVIRDLRGLGNWSMQKLSDISGYSVTTIYTIENSRHGGGHWRTVCDLIDTMGYDILVRKRDEH